MSKPYEHLSSGPAVTVPAEDNVHFICHHNHIHHHRHHHHRRHHRRYFVYFVHAMI